MMQRYWLIGLLACTACADSPRQVILSIDSTASAPCDIDRIVVSARGTGTRKLVRDLRGDRLPLRITLADDTEAIDGKFDLTVTAFKDNVEMMTAAGSLQFGVDTFAPVVLDSSCSPSSPCPFDHPDPGIPRSECVQRYTTDTSSGALFSNACSAVNGNHGPISFPAGSRIAELPLAAALGASDFRFYGHPVRHVWVHQYGYLAFSDGNPDPTNALFPGPLDRFTAGTGAPPPPFTAMGFWDVLSTPEKLCYLLSGEPGTQRLSVTWEHTCSGVPCTPAALSFTISLEERSRQLSIAYDNLPVSSSERLRGANATVGIARQADGCPASECSLATGLCKDDTPCGYSQVFSNVAQPSLVNVTFTPVVED